MTIPLVDLKAQYQTIQDEIDKVVLQVIREGRFILGGEVAKFEQEFARYLGVKHAVGVSSGTSALHLALLACGIQPGDEVIVPSMTFMATGSMVVAAGAKPVFADQAPGSPNLDPEEVEKAVTAKTRAILPVHLYGQPAEMDTLLEIARRHHLRVIEDAAQAHGASFGEQRVGTLGDVGCFSFYPAKNLGAYGDAGMVVTNNDALATEMRALRDHGRTTKYEHTMIGYNYRMDTLQGAILRVKLRHLETWTSLRRRWAELYFQSLDGLDLVLPDRGAHSSSVYHLFVIRSPRRDALQAYLESRGIETGIHYPVPLHLQPAFQYLGYKPGDLPQTEASAREVLSLPMYPELSESQVKSICQEIKAFLGG